MGELSARQGAAAARVVRSLLDWARDAGIEVTWGRGMKGGSFLLSPPGEAVRHGLVQGYTYGRIEVLFQYMQEGPFAALEKREEFRQRLNRIPGVSIPSDALTRRPRMLMAQLDSEAALDELKSALGWACRQVEVWEGGQFGPELSSRRGRLGLEGRRKAVAVVRQQEAQCSREVVWTNPRSGSNC